MWGQNSHLIQVFGVVAQMNTTEVSDVGSTRTVLAITALLLLAAIVLAVVTVWYWKNTVPDPEALASLTEMSAKRTRPWWKLRGNGPADE